MSIHKYRLIIIVVSVFLLTGCTGKSSTPVSPDIGDVTPGNVKETQRMLWGSWDITVDEASLEVSVNPNRISEAHHNITEFVIPPNCTDCLTITVNSFDPDTKFLDVNISLYNPFQIEGFDVRGIFYTDDFGRTLVNSDDWIDLWDIPGGDEINPFKAFAKVEDDRVFESETTHTENYIIYMPTWATVKFAVDVSFPGNCREPYRITNFSSTEIHQGVGGGGFLEVTVNDWQDDVSEVAIEVEEFTGEPATKFNDYGNDVWKLALVNSLGAPAGKYEARIYAKSENDDDLILYDFVTFTVVEEFSTDSGWVQTWEYSDFAYAFELLFDSDGNIVVVGALNEGGMCPSMMKLDPEGNLIWERYIPGHDDPGNPNAFDGVAIDEFNNIYVTGFFSGELDFDPGPGEDIHVSNNWHDVLLIKFDTNGEYVWGKHWGGDLYALGTAWFDRGHGVALDELDGVYVTGMYRGECDFDPGPGEEIHTSNGYDLGGHDAFLSKFDTDGEFKWANTWGAGPHEIGKPYACGDPAFGIAIENTDRIYVTGGFLDTVDFDPGPGVEERTSVAWTGDCYLTRFDSQGNFIWVRTWPGNGEAFMTDIGQEQHLAGKNLAIAADGDIYVPGRFNSLLGPVDFDPGPGIDNHSGHGAFLTRFTSDGEFVRAHTWTDEFYFSGKRTTSVAIDNSGNVLLYGTFGPHIDLDPGTGFDEYITDGGSDSYLCKLSESGDYIWGLTIGTTQCFGSICCLSDGITVDNDGNIYGTGHFYGTVDFDPGPGEEIVQDGSNDSFLLKLTSDGKF